MPDVWTTVAIKLSQPSSEGVVESLKEVNKNVEVVAMPRTVEEGRDILARVMWEGTPDEERNVYVSKLLDSAPYGDGDSKIALVVEDTDEIESLGWPFGGRGGCWGKEGRGPLATGGLGVEGGRGASCACLFACSQPF
ncbi:hypothetical protein JB92DRAFT_2832302 [Gautieria morchelliformis]|nr:hypothetical protein JB92DRAFT_2832302 [Gautieria morchelliformis]